MVSFFGTDTSPSSGTSSPMIIRNSVVLPEPLGPTRPIFSPGLSWKEASTNRICLPYCLLTLENEIIGVDHSLARAGAMPRPAGCARHFTGGIQSTDTQICKEY